MTQLKSRKSSRHNIVVVGHETIVEVGTGKKNEISRRVNNYTFGKI